MLSIRFHPFIICSILFLPLTKGFSQQGLPDINQTKINDELFCKEIADSVIMITHYFPWGGNSLIIIQKDHKAVLIDTPYDGEATSALLAWMEKTYGKLDISVIVTGFHQDNLGGNEVLISKGIPVYGMKLTAILVNDESEGLKKVILESVNKPEQSIYYRRYANLNLTPPDNVFDLKENEHYVLEIGGEKFDFFYPGESHTKDNAVVYTPDRKILFGGCMVRALTDKQPGFIAYANMKAWPISVEKVKNRFPECKLVIPGHGSVGNFELLQHTVDILNAFNAQ